MGFLESLVGNSATQGGGAWSPFLPRPSSPMQGAGPWTPFVHPGMVVTNPNNPVKTRPVFGQPNPVPLPHLGLPPNWGGGIFDLKNMNLNDLYRMLLHRKGLTGGPSPHNPPSAVGFLQNNNITPQMLAGLRQQHQTSSARAGSASTGPYQPKF